MLSLRCVPFLGLAAWSVVSVACGGAETLQQPSLPPPSQACLPESLWVADPQLLAAPLFGAALRALSAGDPAAAAFRLERLAQDFPAHVELAGVHAWALLELGEVAAARRIAQDWATLATAAPDGLRAAAQARERSAYVLGLAWARERNWPRALPWLQLAVPAAPADRRLLAAAAEAALACGAGAAAQEYAAALVRLDADDPAVAELLARAQLAAGAAGAAEAGYRRLAARDPESAAYWAGVGRAAFAVGLNGDAGGFARAAEAWQVAIELRPMDPDLRFRLGCAYHWQEQLAAAEAAYRAALAVEPAWTPAVENLMAVLQAQNRIEQARAVLHEHLRQPLAAAERARLLRRVQALDAPDGAPLERVLPP